MEIRSNAFPASILISVICMIDSWGEDTGIIQKTPSKLIFLHSFNIVLGLIDELLELKDSIKHESKASLALDLLSIQIS